MDQLMTKKESYAERRQLFKDIWEASMKYDEKDDIMTKPKMIKTLRLSEVDRCITKKKKKQKLKNLRTVCKKLLDFCDRQEADDLFYEQMASADVKNSPTPPNTEIETKITKPVNKKKKIKKTRSMFTPAIDRGTTAQKKHMLPKIISRNTSPITVKRTCISFATSKILKSNPTNSSGTRRVVVEKKSISKKMSPNDQKTTVIDN